MAVLGHIPITLVLSFFPITQSHGLICVEIQRVAVIGRFSHGQSHYAAYAFSAVHWRVPKPTSSVCDGYHHCGDGSANVQKTASRQT